MYREMVDSGIEMHRLWPLTRIQDLILAHSGYATLASYPSDSSIMRIIVFTPEF